MWACFNKTCPCLPFRRESKPPLYFSYDDDNLEFETLLGGQDPEAIVTGAPFANNSQGYRSVNNMVTPNEEASASTGNFLDDADNLQTQDAQFLPDESISKFTELISEQAKNNQVTDAQLVAEEEEARRLEEEEYERKRQRAMEAAISKGLMTSDQAAANNKGLIAIDDFDDDDMTDSSRTLYSTNLDGGSSVELSTTASQRNASIDEEEHNTSSLNKPRNPHERFVVKDLYYDDATDYEESPPTNSKDQTTIDDPLSQGGVY